MSYPFHSSTRIIQSSMAYIYHPTRHPASSTTSSKLTVWLTRAESSPSHSIYHSIYHPFRILILKTPGDFIHHTTNPSLYLHVHQPSKHSSSSFSSLLTDLNKLSIHPLNHRLLLFENHRRHQSNYFSSSSSTPNYPSTHSTTVSFSKITTHPTLFLPPPPPRLTIHPPTQLLSLLLQPSSNRLEQTIHPPLNHSTLNKPSSTHLTTVPPSRKSPDTNPTLFSNHLSTHSPSSSPLTAHRNDPVSTLPSSALTIYPPTQPTLLLLQPPNSNNHPRPPTTTRRHPSNHFSCPPSTTPPNHPPSSSNPPLTALNKPSIHPLNHPPPLQPSPNSLEQTIHPPINTHHLHQPIHPLNTDTNPTLFSPSSAPNHPSIHSTTLPPPPTIP
ncbi:hypothetical protein C7M84_025221 [Penaeus vannamei]|uniref:Uncharacterized protein n=1 Tax=Penaeus vannamei TaxID=6689 RepID=A0A3R7SYK0_PENVA|nr:hypothetical protein C7M84_025221 [Penaeus vannamei]